MDKFSILHISDLHRNIANHISNDEIINSLAEDLNTCADEDNLVAKPDFVVVSGDIILGSTQAHEDKAIDEIKEQYMEANELLNELCNTFLDGDKERLIIVPGNHDVCHWISRKSMEMCSISYDEAEKLDDMRKNFNRLDDENGIIRWSWADFCFYQIADLHLYNTRFKEFIAFYNKFYEGKHTYSELSAEQFNIHDFPTYGVTFVGFNSCYMLDHYNKTGRINRDCIDKAIKGTRSTQFTNRLKIAIWHHNTSGYPHESDYMRADMLLPLANAGFVIGLHGHKHVSDIYSDYAQASVNKKMTLISAGSLCAGKKQYGFATPRMYNIIEKNSDRLCIRVRRSTQENHLIWEEHRNIDSIPLPLNKDGSDMEKNLRLLIAAQNYVGILEELEKIDRARTQYKRLWLDCYANLTMVDEYADLLGKPENDDEAMKLASLLAKKQDRVLYNKNLKLIDPKLISPAAIKIIKEMGRCI